MSDATEQEIRNEIHVAHIRAIRARDDYESALRYEQRMKDTLEVMMRA